MRLRFLAAPRGDRSAALQELALLDGQLPPSSHLRLEMGRTYDTLQLAPEALRQYGLWIDTHEHDARLPDALMSRCLLRLRTNEALPLAVKDCEAAIDNESALPHHLDIERATRKEASAVALYGRGLAHQRLGSPEFGERDLARARTLNPRIEEQLRRLGVLLPVPPAAPSSPASGPPGNGLHQ
jgi:tetratricopeptide (TPR) repeat protein